MLISVERTGKNQLEPGRENGGCSKFVTLVVKKKSLTKTDRCAGALSWTRNRLLFLSFSGRFLLTVALRQRRITTYIS